MNMPVFTDPAAFVGAITQHVNPGPVRSAATLEITTMNSTYRLTIAGSWSTLVCVRGTFAGQEWNSRPTLSVLNGHLSLIPAWQKACSGQLYAADMSMDMILGRSIRFHILGGGPDRISTSTVQTARWI